MDFIKAIKEISTKNRPMRLPNWDMKHRLVSLRNELWLTDGFNSKQYIPLISDIFSKNWEEYKEEK